jgi:hypothetical protein
MKLWFAAVKSSAICILIYFADMDFPCCERSRKVCWLFKSDDTYTNCIYFAFISHIWSMWAIKIY